MTHWTRLAGVPFRQGYVEVLGVRTRVLEAGEGLPLVCLHGIAGTLEAHLTLIARLQSEFHVVLYDMPGRGWSGDPDCPYTIDYLSEHLQALIQALALKSPFLIGQSLGGWVAAWAAAHLQGIARGLVLNNPGNVRSRPEGLQRLRESNRRLAEQLTRQEVRSRMAWLFKRKELLTDEDVEIRYLSYTRPEFPRAMEHISAVLVPEIRSRYAWDPSWVRRVTIPVLLIWSEGNPLASQADMEELASWFPKARLEVFLHSGEFPQIEEEDRFVSVVREFVKEVGDERD